MASTIKTNKFNPKKVFTGILPVDNIIVNIKNAIEKYKKY